MLPGIGGVEPPPEHIQPTGIDPTRRQEFVELSPTMPMKPQNFPPWISDSIAAKIQALLLQGCT